MNNSLRDTILIALSISILVVQELVLSFLPNIQLSTLLLLVYTRVYGYKKTAAIVFVYVLIDNLIFGSIAMVHIVVPMFLGWLLIISIFSLVLKSTKSHLIYIIFAYLFGHIYGLMFVPFQVWITHVDPWVYLIADLPWEVIMGMSNALAMLWLFEPLSLALEHLFQQSHHQSGE